jgi:WD40 repeat protein
MEWDSIVCWNGVTGKEIMPRKYRQHNTTNSSTEWIFSPDGKKLVQKGFSPPPDGQLNQLSIYDLTDAGKLLLTTPVPGRLAFSQDRRFIYQFDTTSCKIIDLSTLDSTVKPFVLPAEWLPVTIQQETGIMCAFSQKQKGTFDTAFFYAGVWNLETGVCNYQFLTGAHSWMDSGSGFSHAAFLPDGNGIVIGEGGAYAYDTTSVALFDIPTGKRLLKYPYVRGGGLNCSLTPDGKQLIVGMQDERHPGIYCFDARSGGLQRFFKTGYRRIRDTQPFTFNPVQPRQFLSDSKVWELPPVTAVSVPPQKGVHAALRILAVSQKRVSFMLPNTYHDATVSIYTLNGRMIAQAVLPRGFSRQQSISLPGLSQGVYAYRVGNSDHSLCAEGKFLLP